MARSLVIQVKDKGVIFRSKLEWRYTQFLDYLEIPWVYEPATFDLSVYPSLHGYPNRYLWYIPDLYLPTFNTYLEIKPRFSDRIVRLRLEALSWITQATCLLSENFYRNPPVFWWVQTPESLSLRPNLPSKRSNYAQFSLCSACLTPTLLPCQPHCPNGHTDTRNTRHSRIERAVLFANKPLPADKVWKGKIPRRPTEVQGQPNGSR